MTNEQGREEPGTEYQEDFQNENRDTSSKSNIKSVLKAISSEIQKEDEQLCDAQSENNHNNHINKKDKENTYTERTAERAADILTELSISRRTSKRERNDIRINRNVLKSRKGPGINRNIRTPGLTQKKVRKSEAGGLSVVQRRVLSSTLIEDPVTKKSPADRMARIMHMAVPKKAEPKRKEYAKLDDMRHCRFAPHIKKNPSSEVNHDDDEKESENFVRRMEASNKARVNQLQRAREEKEYDARLDKKECRQCGNQQSYAEYSQKRKKCPSCGVEYRSKLAWGDIKEDFLGRMGSGNDKKEKRKNQIIAESKQPFRIVAKKVYDPERNSTKEVEVPQMKWADVKDDFLFRTQQDQLDREAKKEMIRLKVAHIEGCTFTPKLSKRSQQYDFGLFMDRMNRDIEERQCKQEEMDAKSDYKQSAKSAFW